MGRRQSGGLPAMRLHKPTGCARVYIGGKAVSLGRFGSPEAQLRYDETIAAFIASGRKSVEAARPPAPPAPPPSTAAITVGEVALRWLHHVRDTRGPKSSTYTAGLVAVRALREVRGIPAGEFGPKRLIEVRARFAATKTIRRNGKGEITVEKPRTRRYVNDVMQRIVSLFSWAATMELIPGDKPAALREVKPLRCGEIKAVVETPPRKPVDDARVEAVLKHLRPPMRALVQFCRLTGCRPGEAARLRLADVHDRDQPVWRYTPGKHKNQWRGHGKAIAVGPRAQVVVLEALAGRGDDVYVFDSQAGRPNRSTIPIAGGTAYHHASIRVAITRACKAAGCPQWHPYLLRYARSGEVRKSHGRDAVAATLGDRTTAMADHYAPPGWESAVAAAAATG